MAPTANDSTIRRSHVIRAGMSWTVSTTAATTLARMSAISVPLASRFDHGGLSAGARRRSNRARHVADRMESLRPILQDHSREPRAFARRGGAIPRDKASRGR